MIFTKRSGWSGSCVLVGGLGNLFPGRTVFDKNIHRRVLSETNEFLRRAPTREFYAKRMAFSLQTFFFSLDLDFLRWRGLDDGNLGHMRKKRKKRPHLFFILYTSSSIRPFRIRLEAIPRMEFAFVIGWVDWASWTIRQWGIYFFLHTIVQIMFKVIVR